MGPDVNLRENGLLLVTGSSPRAEEVDRPLAYAFRNKITSRNHGGRGECVDRNILVVSDLWYLNCESLQALPMISIGGPRINAVAARLYDLLPIVLVVENQVLIQMDLTFQDLRVCIWGHNHESTTDALDMFVQKGYLDQYMEAMAARAL